MAEVVAVAPLGDDLGHRVEQAAALGGEDLLAGEPVGAARERSGAGHEVRNATVFSPPPRAPSF
jgi:ABC-type branched-subunit amino acid transport system substrate-binding protein